MIVSGMLGSKISEDGYFTVRSMGGGVLAVERSAKDYEDVEAIRAAAAQLRVVFAGRIRAQTAIVVDLRPARGRSDATFETVWAPLRKELFSGWAAIAVVCKTEVGRMHIQRHMRQDGFDWHVVTDEQAALDHVRGAVRPSFEGRRRE